jgi:2-phospho-L-lactate transferase/gluconeogenesis factor (CofD/UPF0052 family)
MYVVNVMTQPGETASFGPLEHLDGLLGYLDQGVVDVMVVNQAPIPLDLLARYAEEGAEPVLWAGGEEHYRGVRVVAGDIVLADRLIRHDPGRLARLVVRAAEAAG